MSKSTSKTEDVNTTKKTTVAAAATNDKTLAKEDEQVRAEYIAEIKRKFAENKYLDTADQHEISIEDMKLAGIIPS